MVRNISKEDYLIDTRSPKQAADKETIGLFAISSPALNLQRSEDILSSAIFSENSMEEVRTVRQPRMPRVIMGPKYARQAVTFYPWSKYIFRPDENTRRPRNLGIRLIDRCPLASIRNVKRVESGDLQIRAFPRREGKRFGCPMKFHWICT